MRIHFLQKHLRSDTGTTRFIECPDPNSFSKKLPHLPRLTQLDSLNSLPKTHSQLTLTRSVNSLISYVFLIPQIISPLNNPLTVNSPFIPTKTSPTMQLEQLADSARLKTTQVINGGTSMGGRGFILQFFFLI